MQSLSYVTARGLEKVFWMLLQIFRGPSLIDIVHIQSPNLEGISDQSNLC